MLKRWLYSVFIVLLFLGVGECFAFENGVRGTGLVDSWKKLDDLGVDEAIKKNPLHLEMTKKLDDLILDSNPSEANKLIRKINEGLFQAGDVGKEVAEKIKSGAYNQIEGYKTLLKQITKSNDVTPSLNNTVHPVRQAINKFDEFLDEGLNKKFFEKTGMYNGKDFDIDFGIKDALDNIKIGYQLKKVNQPNGIQKALKQSNIDQIRNANVADKRFEIDLLTGTHNDIINNRHVMNKINSVKSSNPDVKFFIKVGQDIRQY